MPTHAYKRASAVAAVVATAGLVTASAGFLAPANAAGTPLTYSCNAPVLGPTPFTVTNDSNAPATMYVGQSAAIKLTSKVTIPGSMASLLYAVGGRTADGTATAKGTIGGKATTSTLAVPTTTIPQEGDLTVTATGNGGTYKATKPGRVTLTAGDFTSTLNIYDEDGAPLTGISPATVPCTAPAGANTTFDTITVKKDKTKVKVATRAKGKKVAAKVTVKTAHGSTAKGKVTVTVKKGKKTVEKKKAHLNKHGKVTVKLPKKLKKGKYTVTVKYAGNAGLKGSTGKHTIKVK